MCQRTGNLPVGHLHAMFSIITISACDFKWSRWVVVVVDPVNQSWDSESCDLLSLNLWEWFQAIKPISGPVSIICLELFLFLWHLRRIDSWRQAFPTTKRIEEKLLLVENHLCVLPINLKFPDISVEILMQRFLFQTEIFRQSGIDLGRWSSLTCPSDRTLPFYFRKRFDFLLRNNQVPSKRKWNSSVQMETLFQSNNAVPFLLANSTGFFTGWFGKMESTAL